MGLNKKTIRDVDFGGKRVLVRCDFNVPMDGNRITDDSRIQAALPTIHYLRERAKVVILCTHLGRPDGVPNEKYSLQPWRIGFRSYWVSRFSILGAKGGCLRLTVFLFPKRQLFC